MDLLSIILAFFGIGLLIFVHESGHFMAARLAGVRVEVFSLGFGPRLWGRRWKGTDFRLSLVPFGGYVLVAGADPSDRRYPPSESLYAKSIAQRTLFWSGGVIMNVLLALIVFPIVFSAGVNFTAPVVGSVQYGSAAWEADIQPGDRVLAVQGRELYSLDNLAVEIALHGHRPVDLLIERDGAEQLVTVVPHFDSASGLNRLGVDPAYGDFAVMVTAGGPAAKAGLQNGDAMVKANGVEATGPAIADALNSGGPFSFEARRGDELISGTIPAPGAKEPLPALIGVQALARKVVGLRKASWIAGLGIERGDTILAIDARPFLQGNLEPFLTGPATLRMHVLREGKEVALAHDVSAAERALLVDHIALGQDNSLRVFPIADRPAAMAGMAAADLVEAINGEPIEDWEQMRELVQDSKGQPLRMRMRRLPAGSTTWFDPDVLDLPRGERIELVVTPQRQPQYDYGLDARAAPLQQEVQATGFGDALRLGTVCSLDLLKQSYVTLKRLITGDVGAQNLGGIIRITQVSYH